MTDTQPDALELAAVAGAVNTLAAMKLLSGNPQYGPNDAIFILGAAAFAKACHGGDNPQSVTYVRPKILAELTDADLERIAASFKLHSPSTRLPPADPFPQQRIGEPLRRLVNQPEPTKELNNEHMA